MIKTILEFTEYTLIKAGAKKLPEDKYSHMKYLSFLPFMHFYVDQYELEGFGHVMSMHTTTKMGMELLTLSFMPNSGKNLPYLLMDSMTMKDKRCVFVEYYGCGNRDLNDAALKKVYEEYRSLPDYNEKPGWYISEREPYSLIKAGTEEELTGMAEASLDAYLSSIDSSVVDPGYTRQLEAFRKRMIEDGNPSSKTLEMLLKKDGAVRFMKEVVMPL
ncbi:MAG: hypothetical protein IJI78_04110 [Oscillospiraceae bacterium]|nr:hypothetical protein [Oscillospiraceae bacterium]